MTMLWCCVLKQRQLEDAICYFIEHSYLDIKLFRFQQVFISPSISDFSNLSVGTFNLRTINKQIYFVSLAQGTAYSDDAYLGKSNSIGFWRSAIRMKSFGKMNKRQSQGLVLAILRYAQRFVQLLSNAISIILTHIKCEL